MGSRALALNSRRLSLSPRSEANSNENVAIEAIYGYRKLRSVEGEWINLTSCSKAKVMPCNAYNFLRKPLHDKLHTDRAKIPMQIILALTFLKS